MHAYWIPSHSASYSVFKLTSNKKIIQSVQNIFFHKFCTLSTIIDFCR